MVTTNQANTTSINPTPESTPLPETPVSYSGESVYVFAPDGLIYNPNTNTFFVTTTVTDGVVPGTPFPLVTQKSIDQYTLDGELISSFTPKEFTTVVDVSLLPNGNLIIVDGASGIIREYTTDGQPVENGINLDNIATTVANPDGTLGGTSTSGLFYNAETNTIFGGDFFGAIIREYDTQGNIISTLALSDKLANGTNFSGLTIDPLTGNFFAVDDNRNVPGDNTLYEITRLGEIVSSRNLFELTGYKDPEGLSIDPVTRTLYVAFDGDNAVGTPVPGLEGNRIVSLHLDNGSVCTPEPAPVPEVQYPCFGTHSDTSSLGHHPFGGFEHLSSGGDNYFNAMSGHHTPIV